MGPQFASRTTEVLGEPSLIVLPKFVGCAVDLRLGSAEEATRAGFCTSITEVKIKQRMFCRRVLIIHVSNNVNYTPFVH